MEAGLAETVDVVPSVMIEAASVVARDGSVVVLVVVVSKVVVVLVSTVFVVSFGAGTGAGCAGVLGPQFAMQLVEVQVSELVLQ